MSLDCVRKPEYPGRTHADMGRTCKLVTEKPLAPKGFKPGTFCHNFGMRQYISISVFSHINLLHALPSHTLFVWPLRPLPYSVSSCTSACAFQSSSCPTSATANSSYLINFQKTHAEVVLDHSGPVSAPT